MLERIAQLPRPRHVFIKKSVAATEIGGNILFTIAWFYISVLIWKGRNSITDISLIFWLPLVPYILIGNARDFFQQRRLLEQGEVALGRVFHVRRGRHGRRIEFSFQDNSGRIATALARDSSYSIRKVGEGSGVIVFYDPANPEKRCVTSGATPWEVKLPSVPESS
ncbi:MAG TPA: DUF3592 domain-containing protein [Candidatus Acidoferrales bacterium]|nr:DUF3592 domain-containing protein [Candidatus Acidoferrales bacterium]